jgi:hypothetical protein
MTKNGKILLALGSLVLFLACRSSLFSLCVASIDSVPPCHANSSNKANVPEECDCPLSHAEIQKPSTNLFFLVVLTTLSSLDIDQNVDAVFDSFPIPKPLPHYSDHHYSHQSSIRLLI